jgi:hypothetical protein
VPTTKITSPMIRFGRNDGTAETAVRVASIAWRSGNNPALPSHTFRGRGFDGGV